MNRTNIRSLTRRFISMKCDVTRFPSVVGSMRMQKKKRVTGMVLKTGVSFTPGRKQLRSKLERPRFQ